ncbi:MAG: hypothetical protein ACC628_24315 [Pirellulaceae bacterium]
MGSLVNIYVTISSNAITGPAAINLAASSGAQFTALNEGELTLVPAPTNNADDAVDGRITVSGVNGPPTVALQNMVTALPEDTNTTSRTKVADMPQFADATGELPATRSKGAFYFDVNGDWFSTPVDALMIVNYLNRSAEPEGEGSQTTLSPLTEIYSHPPNSWRWQPNDIDYVQDSWHTDRLESSGEWNMRTDQLFAVVGETPRMSAQHAGLPSAFNELAAELERLLEEISTDIGDVARP